MSRSILCTHAVTMEYSTVDTHLPNTQTIEREKKVFRPCWVSQKTSLLLTQQYLWGCVPLWRAQNMHNSACERDVTVEVGGWGAPKKFPKMACEPKEKNRSFCKAGSLITQWGVNVAGNNGIVWRRDDESSPLFSLRWLHLLITLMSSLFQTNPTPRVFFKRLRPYGSPHEVQRCVFKAMTFSHVVTGLYAVTSLKYLSTFTQVLCLSTVLRYFAGVFPFYATFCFYSKTQYFTEYHGSLWNSDEI